MNRPGVRGLASVLFIAFYVTTSVDDKAVPIAFQGSWLGSISDGKQVAKISKAEISAQLPPTPPSP